jgi:hypothetical protein
MHRKEENLTENNTTPMGSEIHTKHSTMKGKPDRKPYHPYGFRNPYTKHSAMKKT